MVLGYKVGQKVATTAGKATAATATKTIGSVIKSRLIQLGKDVIRGVKTFLMKIPGVSTAVKTIQSVASKTGILFKSFASSVRRWFGTIASKVASHI